MSRKNRQPPAARNRPSNPAVPNPAVQAERLLSDAIGHHRAGRLAEAEVLYRRALALAPAHTDALHLLGVALLQQGAAEEAEALIRRALDRDPGFAAAWNSLGNLLRQRGQSDPDALWEAASAYRRAVALKSDYTEAYANLGATLLSAGKPDAAATACRQALDIDPGHLDALYNLGFALIEQGHALEAEGAFRRVTEIAPGHDQARFRLGRLLQARGHLAGAEACFRQVLSRHPDEAEVLMALADTLQLAKRLEEAVTVYARVVAIRPDWPAAHNNLGVALHDLGRPAEAARQFRTALAEFPDYADAYANLGRALLDLDQTAEAVACLTRAVDLDPGSPEAHTTLGIALKNQGRLVEAAQAHIRALIVAPAHVDAHANLGVVRKDQGLLIEATACQRRALQIVPRHAKALSNLGALAQAQGDLDTAEAYYAQAVAADPHFAQAHWNRALTLLARGSLEEGWADYGWRFPAGQARPWRRLAIPEWQGEPLAGKRVLVWREQGVGDELMFASCYRDLIAQAGHVIIECDPRLVGLFARSFPEATVRAETAEPHDAGPHDAGPHNADVQVPAGSLPRHVRPGLERFPDTHAFLVADLARMTRWYQRLTAIGPGLKVGICWRSQLLSGERGEVYTGLKQWEPLLTRSGAHFVRLQYDECEAEMREAERRFGITIHRWNDIDLKNDFEEVAALMSALDLVITGPTSVGELAAALGVPTWRMAFAGDWTQLGTDRRPWFPTMRLFYGRAGHTLDDMLQRMAACLPVPDTGGHPYRPLDQCLSRFQAESAGGSPLPRAKGES